MFWRYWDASGKETVTVNPTSLRTSISPDLLNERPNEAIAERSFPQTRHSDPVIPDEGSELAGLKEARVEAIHLAGSILRDEGDEFWNGEE